jgi:hypothetical protein
VIYPWYNEAAGQARENAVFNETHGKSGADNKHQSRGY